MLIQGTLCIHPRWSGCGLKDWNRKRKRFWWLGYSLRGLIYLGVGERENLCRKRFCSFCTWFCHVMRTQDSIYVSSIEWNHLTFSVNYLIWKGKTGKRFKIFWHWTAQHLAGLGMTFLYPFLLQTLALCMVHWQIRWCTKGTLMQFSNPFFSSPWMVLFPCTQQFDFRAVCSDLWLQPARWLLGVFLLCLPENNGTHCLHTHLNVLFLTLPHSRLLFHP